MFYSLLILLTMTFSSEKRQDVSQITLGGGCFWCTEAIYNELKGIIKVEPGYSGGHKNSPTYQEVSNRTTGHAEVIQITFNRSIITLDDILEIFFLTHDPTTPNRQDYDIGNQYRSIIFFHNENQKLIITKIIKLITNKKIYTDPIITEVIPFKTFYPAENYHYNYYSKNKNQPYCRIVITPKIKKLKKRFPDKIK